MNPKDREFLFDKARSKNCETLDFVKFFNLVADYERKKFRNFLRNSNTCEMKQKPLLKSINSLKPDPKSLTLNKVEGLFKQLYKVRGRLKKQNIGKAQLT